MLLTIQHVPHSRDPAEVPDRRGGRGQKTTRAVRDEAAVCVITGPGQSLRSGFCYGNETKLFFSGVFTEITALIIIQSESE